MAEYSRMAKGNFTNTAVASVAPTSTLVTLPFQPDYVEIWNYTNIKTAGTHSITRAWWDAKLVDAVTNTVPTMVELYSGSSTSVVFDQIANTVAQPGINAFSAGQLLQFGPSKQVVSATAANPAVFTVTAHGYAIGDTVVFRGLFQSATTGMAQMNGIPFTITAVTANTFTVKWDASGSYYTALSGSPTGAFVQKLLYPFLYVPQNNVIAFLTLAATTTVTTTAYHNFESGQQVAFRVPQAWGTTQLNSLPDLLIPGQPIYGYVQSVTDNWTFVVNINSTGYTTFTPNVGGAGTAPAINVTGLTPAQVLAVGDVNTGGIAFNGGALYPSPMYPSTTNRISSINGPTIRGAFANNTFQGFTIGAGIATVDGTATLMSGTVTNQIYWHAYAHDYGNP